MPVLSWSLIGDRTAHRQRKHRDRKAMAIHEFPRRDRARPETYPGPPMDQHASCAKPDHPDLRANPYPEVTDPICRLPLPTLFYRPEAVTLETCCGYGYELARHHRNLPRIFKVPPTTRGCRENCGTLRQDQNHSPCERNSRASVAYAEKTTLPRVSVASPSRVALPRRKKIRNGSAARF